MSELIIYWNPYLWSFKAPREPNIEWDMAKSENNLGVKIYPLANLQIEITQEAPSQIF